MTDIYNVSFVCSIYLCEFIFIVIKLTAIIYVIFNVFSFLSFLSLFLTRLDFSSQMADKAMMKVSLYTFGPFLYMRAYYSILNL